MLYCIPEWFPEQDDQDLIILRAVVSRIAAQQVDVSDGRTINLWSTSGLTGSEKRRTRAGLYILADTLFDHISFLFLFLSSHTLKPEGCNGGNESKDTWPEHSH